MIGFPLLVLPALLFPVISAQTIFQTLAGVELTPPKIVGPVGGFLVLGVLAVWIVVLLWKDLGADRDHTGAPS